MGNLNTTPRTWVANELVDEIEMNAEVRDTLTAIQAAWTSYTPTTTNITVGNGTVTGSFNRQGKTLSFKCIFTFGSTSAVSASPTFTLPAGMTAKEINYNAGGKGTTIFDTSAGSHFPAAAILTSTTVVTCRVFNATAGNAYAVISSTVPMTWATGDVLTVLAECELA